MARKLLLDLYFILVNCQLNDTLSQRRYILRGLSKILKKNISLIELRLLYAHYYNKRAPRTIYQPLFSLLGDIKTIFHIFQGFLLVKYKETKKNNLEMNNLQNLMSSLFTSKNTVELKPFQETQLNFVNLHISENMKTVKEFFKIIQRVGTTTKIHHILLIEGPSITFQKKSDVALLLQPQIFILI